MERKYCTHCNVEKKIEDFYNKYTDCKNCQRIRSLKRYYEKQKKCQTDEQYISKKNREKLLQKQNNRYTNY